MEIKKLLRKNIILIVILIIAILLRFLAVKPGFNQYHGDETAIWGAALHMVKNSTYDPSRYDYPATTMIINAFAFKTFFIPVSWFKYYVLNFSKVIDGTLNLIPTKLEVNRLFDLYIAGERGVNAIFWARYVTAFFGIGTIFLTYLLSKKMFGKTVGLIAALFLTFNYRNVMNSHLSLPDIYNAFFTLLALLSSWNLIKNPSKKAYFWAGLSAGVSFSVKYQIFGILPFIVAHIFLWVKSGFKFKNLFDSRFIMGGLLIPLVFLITNPYFFLNLDTVIPDMKYEFLKYGMRSNHINYFPLSNLYHLDYGPIQSVLVIMGILIALLKKPLKALFLLSVIISSYWMFIYYSKGGFYIRNFIPTTPLLLMFAAFFVYQCFFPFIKKYTPNIKFLILLPVLAIIIYLPAKNSILSTYGYTKPWAYGLLKPWINKNLPGDAVVGISYFDKTELGIKNKSIETDLDKAFGLAEQVDMGANYGVINFNGASSPFYSWMNYDPKEVKRFWNKPLDILRNTYYGLAAEELFRYQVFTVTKPWQSPDTHFIVTKFPLWPNVKMKEISKFGFNQGSTDWQVYGVLNPDEEKRYAYDDKVGRNKKGSIVSFKGGSRFPILRISSKPVPVKPNYLYKVEGFLKPDVKVLLEEKNAFIRVDFWGDDTNFDRLGIKTALSSRLYGESEWTKKTITDIAPESAKYLTISFQSNTSAAKIWIDDVTIFESESEVEDMLSKFPYTKDFIDLNYLYPNSHGNL